MELQLLTRDLIDAVVSRRLVTLCVAPGAAPGATSAAGDRAWFLDIRQKPDLNNNNSRDVINLVGGRGWEGGTSFSIRVKGLCIYVSVYICRCTRSCVYVHRYI